MKVDTLEHLITWSSAVHTHLAKALDAATAGAGEGPASLFADYAAGHERNMAEQIAAMIGESDPKALQTWVYDWLEHPPPAPEGITRNQDSSIDLDSLGRELFSAHNEIMRLFHQLMARADTAEVEELITRMIDIEEGHTRQMAQQLNRTRDM
ncbi:MAG: hypothetical protein JJT88_06420 [Gammaproteobacteria bacterium]|nr:hypothetical protein [Gammaproteobacteria bacterium]